MKQNYLKSLLLMLMMCVGMSAWADSYDRLESIASIDEDAEYVLGIDGTGFHYSGTSSWGLCAKPDVQTPLKYKLVVSDDGKSFTASTDISNTTYYLTVPTTNTFTLSTTSSALILGTTYSSAGTGKEYAVTNSSTTTRHLRINGTSGLRSYAGTTGTIAFFYKVVSDGSTVSSISIKTAPNKVSYMEGETFNPKGLVITKTLANGTTEDVSYGDDTKGNFAFDPSLETELSNETSVTITYGGKTATQTITVSPFVVTAGTYNINTNNGLYGISTGNNGTEQSATKFGITIVSGCKSSASSKTYYDTAHIRYYVSSYLKLTAPAGFEITSVVFTAGDRWDGSITVNQGTYQNATKKWEGNTEQLEFSFAAQNRVSSISVTYAIKQVKTLASISVTGQKTSFHVGDDFSFNGIVMANYEENGVESANVTSKVTITGYDMDVAGSQTVTVSYTEDGVTKTADYNISVRAYEYDSLEDLVADCTPTGTPREVTVMFEDKEITELYLTGSGYRNGVYVMAGEQKVLIYCRNVPESWIIGGTVSGILTCDWKLYSGNWELCPENWDNITYSAPTADITISSAGYTTYYNSTTAYIMPDDCEGYVFTAANGLARVYNAEEVVPAGEPLVIYTIEPGTKTLSFTTSSKDTYKSADKNDLDGTDEATALAADDNCYFYGLTMGKGEKAGKVGFFWMNETGAAFTNGAHKAYLKLPMSAGIKGFAFEDMQTAINVVETTAPKAIFDLQGRKVSAAQKGLYIINGKKVVK